MSGYRNALTVQGRVLYALILKEARGRFGKSRIGYLWALVEPLAHVLTLVLIFGAMGRKSPVGNDLAVFFTTGIVPWLLYNNIAKRVSGALGANQALLNYPHVSAIDILFGRILLEAATMCVVFALLVFALIAMGKAVAVYDLFHVLMALVVMTVFASGVGMINSTIRIYWDSWDKVFTSFSRPLYFVSGVFFTVDMLPPAVRQWVEWNPILQYVEWCRAGFFATVDGDHIKYGYSLFVAFLVFFIGFGGATKTRYKARNL